MNTQLENRSFIGRLTFRNWVSVALVVVAIAFILQNRDVVSVDLFSVNIQLRLWICLSLVFIAGWLSGRLSRKARA
jgi:uncharacterized integral membrane protein